MFIKIITYLNRYMLFIRVCVYLYMHLIKIGKQETFHFYYFNNQ